jgi:hypothetical protein
MTTAAILKKVKTSTLGKAPVVVLPMEVWTHIQDLLEDVEILHSKRLKKDIVKARQQVKQGKTKSLKDL